MKNRELKNVLRDQLCENCHFFQDYDKNHVAGWCVHERKKPKSTTCCNWQKMGSDGFTYTFKSESEMDDHLVKGNALSFTFDKATIIKRIEVHSPCGEPLYYIDHICEFPSGGGTLTIEPPKIEA